MLTNPAKVTAGATFMQRVLKMSSLNASAVEPELLMSIKPIITITIPTASRMKLVFPKAKFFLSISLTLNSKL